MQKKIKKWTKWIKWSLVLSFFVVSSLFRFETKSSMSNQILNADAPPKVTHSTRHAV